MNYSLISENDGTLNTAVYTRILESAEKTEAYKEVDRFALNDFFFIEPVGEAFHLTKKLLRIYGKNPCIKGKAWMFEPMNIQFELNGGSYVLSVRDSTFSELHIRFLSGSNSSIVRSANFYLYNEGSMLPFSVGIFSLWQDDSLHADILCLDTCESCNPSMDDLSAICMNARNVYLQSSYIKQKNRRVFDENILPVELPVVCFEGKSTHIVSSHMRGDVYVSSYLKYATSDYDRAMFDFAKRGLVRIGRKRSPEGICWGEPLRRVSIIEKGVF